MSIQTIILGTQTIRLSIKPGEVGATPLLIFTGIGASLSLLAPFVEAMAVASPNTPIITFDYPGVSGSSTPFFPYRFSGLAKIVSDMLDYLNVGQVDVLGLSWGGYASQEFVHQYPHRTRKLILANTPAGVLAIPPSMRVLSLMSSPRRYNDAAYMSEIAPEIYGGKFRTDPTLAIKYAEKMQEDKSGNKGNNLGYTYQQMCICWWSSLWFLPSIKQPTLLMAGSDDPIIKLCNMEIMNKLLPNAELKVIDQGGHLFLLTHLEEVLPLITEFLEK